MTDPRALLDAYAGSWTDPDGECDHDCNDNRGRLAPKAFVALRAVLDLHQPHANGSLTCVECSECEDTYDDVPWPCPTVTAITTALEVPRD